MEQKFSAVAQQPELDQGEHGEECEEEAMTDDECIAPIVCEYQDNDTVLILSDDECVMSPQKGKASLGPIEPDVGASGGKAPVASVPADPQRQDVKAEVEEAEAPGSSAVPQPDQSQVAPVLPAASVQKETESKEAQIAKEEEEAITSDQEQTSKEKKQVKATFKVGFGTYVDL